MSRLTRVEQDGVKQGLIDGILLIIATMLAIVAIWGW